MSDNDDDNPQLSEATFAALQEFYKEQKDKEDRLLAVVTTADTSVIEEDWQLSQFWYNDKTIQNLIEIAIKSVGPNSKIALISCPSLFKNLKERMNEEGEVILFEYDERFKIYGQDFVPYDYKAPLSIPRDKCRYYDLVIADPPYLSAECLTKTSVTMKFLTKHKLLLCTGAIMGELAQKLLDVRLTSFRPQHRKNLANEFYCYANYDIEAFVKNI